MTNDQCQMTNECIVYLTKSSDDTVLLGKRFGAVIQPNDVIALTGTLGAGKTTLIQGMASGAGVKEYVTSPTFIIINEHKGNIPFYHIDLYRLEDINDIEDLGIEEYFNNGGVCLIEWAERLGALLPKKSESISIEILSDNERKICVSSGLAQRLK